jgi:hypothetical protein
VGLGPSGRRQARGEVAANIPIEVIGDPAFGSVPAGCSSAGTAEDTLATFGSNGLIGINQILPDCGASCASSPAQEGGYYSCSGSTCAAVAVPVAAQLQNPIASFGTDNNGAVMQFPAVPAAGAPTLAGTLTFGIGTAANNALGGTKVLTVDSAGNLTTLFNGATMATSYVDSGTTELDFDDTSIAQCTSSQSSGFFCPASPVSLTAQLKGQNGAAASVAFSVESADTLFSGSNTAFEDLAGPGSDAKTFAWGFPFFIGRSVFVALDGASTPGGNGPYVAF